jgi:hypothetical protein
MKKVKTILGIIFMFLIVPFLIFLLIVLIIGAIKYSPDLNKYTHYENLQSLNYDNEESSAYVFMLEIDDYFIINFDDYVSITKDSKDIYSARFNDQDKEVILSNGFQIETKSCDSEETFKELSSFNVMMDFEGSIVNPFWTSIPFNERPNVLVKGNMQSDKKIIISCKQTNMYYEITDVEYEYTMRGPIEDIKGVVLRVVGNENGIKRDIKISCKFQ